MSGAVVELSDHAMRLESDLAALPLDQRTVIMFREVEAIARQTADPAVAVALIAEAVRERLQSHALAVMVPAGRA